MWLRNTVILPYYRPRWGWAKGCVCVCMFGVYVYAHVTVDIAHNAVWFHFISWPFKQGIDETCWPDFILLYYLLPSRWSKRRDAPTEDELVFFLAICSSKARILMGSCLLFLKQFQFLSETFFYFESWFQLGQLISWHQRSLTVPIGTAGCNGWTYIRWCIFLSTHSSMQEWEWESKCASGRDTE